MEDKEGIIGLIYLDDFVSKEEEANLLQDIDNQTWVHETRGQETLKRRNQQYGYR
jgi:hypothetical protein